MKDFDPACAVPPGDAPPSPERGAEDEATEGFLPSALRGHRPARAAAGSATQRLRLIAGEAVGLASHKDQGGLVEPHGAKRGAMP